MRRVNRKDLSFFCVRRSHFLDCRMFCNWRSRRNRRVYLASTGVFGNDLEHTLLVALAVSALHPEHMPLSSGAEPAAGLAGAPQVVRGTGCRDPRQRCFPAEKRRFRKVRSAPQC